MPAPRLRVSSGKSSAPAIGSPSASIRNDSKYAGGNAKLSPSRLWRTCEAGVVRSSIRAVSVTGPVAVDPEIVVPLQVVGTNAIDERDELIHHPFPPGRAGEADLRVARGAVVVAP